MGLSFPVTYACMLTTYTEHHEHSSLTQQSTDTDPVELSNSIQGMKDGFNCGYNVLIVWLVPEGDTDDSKHANLTTTYEDVSTGKLCCQKI